MIYIMKQMSFMSYFIVIRLGMQCLDLPQTAIIALATPKKCHKHCPDQLL